MPRDGSGNFTFDEARPEAGEIINADWMNDILDDVENGLTDSLSRSGKGGMQAPLPFDDGSQANPGITWTNELGSGFFRAANGDMQVSVLGQLYMRWNGNKSYIRVGGVWEEIAYVGSGSSIPDGDTPGGLTRLNWNGTAWIAAKPDITDGSTDTAIPTWSTANGQWSENGNVTVTAGGNVTATGFTGPLTGNVTGNLTGNADTATSATSATTATTADNATQLGGVAAANYPKATNVAGSGETQPTDFQVLTQAEYDGLTPASTTVYFIV